MTDRLYPTEQELDALLEQPPQFDPERVKALVRSRGTDGDPAPRKRRGPLATALIAAVICALSASALAAAGYYVAGGGIVRLFGLVSTQEEAVHSPQPESENVSSAPDTTPTGEAEVDPVEQVLPQLDDEIAEALHISQPQAQQLRPAVQDVDGPSDSGDDVAVTVVQTLGDPFTLYIKLQVDLPETVALTEDLDFHKISLSLDPEPTSYGITQQLLERGEHALTYLLTLHFYEPLKLNGQSATITLQDLGHSLDAPEDILATLTLSGGTSRTVIIDPQGSINAEASPEDAAALAAAVERTEQPGDGFTVDYLTDGTIVVTYDGTCGVRYLTVLGGDAPAVVTGGRVDFETVLEGQWSLGWELSYQDISLRWSGEAAPFDPSLTVTSLGVSPLSWRMEIRGDEYASLSMLSALWEAQLRHEDGSLTTLELDPAFTYTHVDGEVYTLTVVQWFDTLIDVSDVTAVILNGVEFPLA